MFEQVTRELRAGVIRRNGRGATSNTPAGASPRQNALSGRSAARPCHGLRMFSRSASPSSRTRRGRTRGRSTRGRRTMASEAAVRHELLDLGQGTDRVPATRGNSRANSAAIPGRAGPSSPTRSPACVRGTYRARRRGSALVLRSGGTSPYSRAEVRRWEAAGRVARHFSNARSARRSTRQWTRVHVRVGCLGHATPDR